MFLLHEFPFIIALHAFPKHQYISLTLNLNIQSDIHTGIAEKPPYALHLFFFCSILPIVSNILLFFSTSPIVSNMLLSFVPHYLLFLTHFSLLFLITHCL